MDRFRQQSLLAGRHELQSAMEPASLDSPPEPRQAGAVPIPVAKAQLKTQCFEATTDIPLAWLLAEQRLRLPAAKSAAHVLVGR